MDIQKIDLYSYFKVKRPNKSCQGYLTVYGHVPNEREAEDRTRPAMLVVGGGGYEYVSIMEKEPVALHFYGEGFNAYVIEYTCKPFGYPVAMLETCMALAYIRENADKYKTDVKHVAMIGFSAGAHLCGTVATLYDSQIVKETLKEKASLCRPDAVVFSYPVVDMGEYAHEGSMEIITKGDKKLKELLSFQNHITSKTPPAFIWTTANDDCVPSENSLLLALAYKKANVNFELHVFEKGIHGLSICNAETINLNPEVAYWKVLCLNFLIKHGFKVKN